MAPVELLQEDHTRQLVRKRERAEREAMVDLLELQPEGPTDHEAQILAAEPAAFKESAQGDRVHGLPAAMQQRREAAPREPPGNPLVVGDLDQLEPRVAREQLLVVLDVVEKRGTQPPHGHHDDPHNGILGTMDDPGTPDRRINIHFSPEHMGGAYANFANVSHSDYEFTVTFARVDHEVEEEEVPGVVVSRINLSPRFMRELIDAMQDNFSKWQTREGIKNLPEFGGRGEEDEE